MKRVVVVDFGAGNLKSVQRGFEKVGATVLLSSIPEEIAAADYLVLPGVGGFRDGMQGLRKAGVIPAIFEFARSGNPLLGICLGMQMLFDQSEEHGLNEGLGLIEGVVKEIPRQGDSARNRKIPHIGWSAILPGTDSDGWKNTMFENTVEGEYFYFVHSFMANPIDSSKILAQCNYEGESITAAVHKENITGLQFHPEKSGYSGLQLLKNLVSR